MSRTHTLANLFIFPSSHEPRRITATCKSFDMFWKGSLTNLQKGLELYDFLEVAGEPLGGGMSNTLIVIE
jgi:hypothetical protein